MRAVLDIKLLRVTYFELSPIDISAKKIFVIQDRPFSSMEMVEVPLPDKRDRSDLKRPEIVELKEQLIGKLRRSVNV